MKYILYIEYRVNKNPSFEYMAMKARSFEEAIEEAEKIYNPETMYLIQIMQKKARHLALTGTRSGITKQLSAREPQRVVGMQKKVDTL